MTAADRFDDDPLSFDPEHPDLGWTISEAVPFEEWPNGSPRGLWLWLSLHVVTPLWRRWDRIRTWKRAHDRCAVWWCWRRRWKYRPSFSSHGRCWRHMDPASRRVYERDGCTKRGCPA